jgi:hypothetical protein
MVSTGRMRLVYGGDKNEFINKEHYSLNLVEMEPFTFGSITAIDEESVTVTVCNNQDLFLNQIENGFKVCFCGICLLNGEGNEVTNMIIMYCSTTESYDKSEDSTKRL